ncbi:hypothetical protein BGP75_17565 [Motiliproteus sp. MSK22-1]|nr:hypothetical protein BGP75_17565 [Motiliproteus sp. MSK22-1]
MHNLYDEILRISVSLSFCIAKDLDNSKNKQTPLAIVGSSFTPLIVETRPAVIRARALLQKNEESLQIVRLILSDTSRRGKNDQVQSTIAAKRV